MIGRGPLSCTTCCCCWGARRSGRFHESTACSFTDAKTMRVVGIVPLLGLLGLFSSAFAEERGHLVVKKSLVGEYAVQGKNATIQLEIFNVGDR